MSAAPILAIDALRIEYPLSEGGTLVAVEGATLTIAPGEIHALVGESGAGKTTIGNAVLGLLEKPGRIASGAIALDGKPFDPTKPGDIRLGRDIGAVFQDPMTSLNPLFTIESQIVETLRAHLPLDRRAARARALDLLRAVGMPEPERRLSAYPHQLSGGQRQRVVIACALACEPRLLVADEPTTALDVSIQAQILDLLRGLADERGIGILLVTHNMGVVAQIADTVTIMHRGHVVESGPVAQVLRRPQADYARALIGAVPRIDVRLDRFPMLDGVNQGNAETARTELRRRAGTQEIAAPAADAVPLLSVESLVVDYGAGLLSGRGSRAFRAVDGVSFEIRPGEVFGLVGESGCGKTTIANVVAGLRKPTGGTIRFDGKVIAGEAAAPRVGRARRAIQMIFQDPYSSLNARMRVGHILAEPILFYELARTRAEAAADVDLLVQAVGLPPETAQRFPHAFSGGQRQRLSIARALGARPRLIVCDEPTSSLDVSVQAQILNLLKDLRDATGLTLLLISHDLAVIRQMCDRVAVMRSGQIVEMEESETLFAAPKADYTRQLLALVPTLERIRGEADIRHGG
ncbi:MAG: ABC transporter ATP-binding protein [Beijerinckiaceae bacterium]|nr:ABC transporter ATP-binding protein [Beijerinckiaceae bacterium]